MILAKVNWPLRRVLTRISGRERPHATTTAVLMRQLAALKPGNIIVLGHRRYCTVPLADGTATSKMQTKTASHTERPLTDTNLQRATSKNSSSQVSVKHMQEIEVWFDSIIQRGEQENDVGYWARILKAVKSRLHESYKAGQRSKVASSICRALLVRLFLPYSQVRPFVRSTGCAQF